MSKAQKRFTPDTPTSEKLLYFFERCKLWPENSPEAMGALLELRALAEPAALELERLHKRVAELERAVAEAGRPAK